LLEQPLEVLPRREQERLTIDAPEPSQAEPSHAMPLLAFCEERFDPYLALAHRLGVGLALVVCADPVEEGLGEVAVDNASVGAGRTLALH
jgi:hypothetical protein